MINSRNTISCLIIFLFTIACISCSLHFEPNQRDSKEVHGKKITVQGVEIEYIENKYADWTSHGQQVRGGKLIGVKYKIKNTSNKMVEVRIVTDIKTSNNSSIYQHKLESGFRRELSEEALNNNIPSGIAPNGEITIWQSWRVSGKEVDLPVKFLIASITVNDELSKKEGNYTEATLVVIE